MSEFYSPIRPNMQTLSLLSLDIIDKDLLDEVKKLADEGSIAIYFGKTLRDLKCVIKDDNSETEHELFIHYKGPKKLTIVSVSLPYSSLQEKEYRSLEEIATAYKNYVNNLAPYCYELERIDRFCSVMQPLHPSFKDDYRRILLDERTWLHVEVTTAGLATNIHLIGQSDLWHDKLQSGLLSWDHDKDIVENIMSVFVQDLSTRESPTCGICLCDELPDDLGLPLPLCQNPTCGVHFHRNCLYQV
ncbi:putative ubiquitin ligase protein FANCL [Operophtera brumata]|uniref:Putative ubiquitin ligase protein FANCL n=1 Tax=Operophtera brumata TaxID=104452 RepID=A0A0L7LGP1_OPEBR|nr:putative ubiquitin ligase protein FANCL [Operophtera brumata]